MIKYKGLNISDEKFIPELKKLISKFESDEQLLRSGGIPIDLLDRLAHGFSEDDLTTVTPDKLKIKWKDDLENVKWEIRQSGLTPKKWAEKINLSEPIDVTFREDKEHKKGFYLEDGHHRYMAAKILGKPLNMNLEIRTSPIMTIAPNMSYDDFHRYVFKEFKTERVNENTIRKLLREALTNMNVIAYRAGYMLPDRPVFFASNIKVAQHFGKPLKYNVTLHNPLIIEDANTWIDVNPITLAKKIGQEMVTDMYNYEYGTEFKTLKDVINHNNSGGDPFLLSTDSISAYIKKNTNYKSIIFKDIGETEDASIYTDVYVIFDPKSAEPI